MSTFGSPGGRQIVAKPIPPERGSFPLDHDAECQPLMKRYLACLRSQRGVNAEECRVLSKEYLQCRMERYVTC
jgi:cytochrome c oxidase assembly protein subunit 19